VKMGLEGGWDGTGWFVDSPFSNFDSDLAKEN
jgi:hypothetical protein